MCQTADLEVILPGMPRSQHVLLKERGVRFGLLDAIHVNASAGERKLIKKSPKSQAPPKVRYKSTTRSRSINKPDPSAAFVLDT